MILLLSLLTMLLSAPLIAQDLTDCPPGIADPTLDADNEEIFENYLAAVPAVAKNPTCGENLGELQTTLRRTASRVLPPLQKEQNAWISRILQPRAAADAAAACAWDKELEELEEFLLRYKFREQQFTQNLDDAEKILGVMKAEIDTYAHLDEAREYFRCLDESEIYNNDGSLMENSPVLAAANCTKNKKLKKLGPSFDLLSDGWIANAGLNCLLDPATPDLKKIMREAVALRARLQRQTQANKAAVQKEKTAFKKLRRQVNKIRASLAGWNCGEQRRREEEELAELIPQLKRNDGYGTGFFVKNAKGQSELVTAHHLAFDVQKEYPEAKSLKYPSRGLPTSTTMEKRPGSYDLGGDLAKAVVMPRKKLLELVDETYLPALGEELTITGYPGNRDGKMTTHRCQMMGLGNGYSEVPSLKFQPADSLSYYLHCPGAESHIAGMSGAPVRNKNGTVVAVFNAHYDLSNVAIAQPVSRDAHGDLQAGFRRVFHYAHCYADYKMLEPPKPCQVIPGLTLEKVVP